MGTMALSHCIFTTTKYDRTFTSRINNNYHTMDPSVFATMEDYDQYHDELETLETNFVEFITTYNESEKTTQDKAIRDTAMDNWVCALSSFAEGWDWENVPDNIRDDFHHIVSVRSYVMGLDPEEYLRNLMPE